VAHSREKVCKSASARDSHARRICLKFPRESTPGPRAGEGEAVLPGSSAWALREHRESFVRAERSVHVAAARLEPPPSFPPPRSLKCQIIGRTYVRSLCLSPPPPPPPSYSTPSPLPPTPIREGRSALDALIPPGFLNRVADSIDFCRAFPLSPPPPGTVASALLTDDARTLCP